MTEEQKQWFRLCSSEIHPTRPSIATMSKWCKQITEHFRDVGILFRVRKEGGTAFVETSVEPDNHIDWYTTIEAWCAGYDYAKKGD